MKTSSRGRPSACGTKHAMWKRESFAVTNELNNRAGTPKMTHENSVIALRPHLRRVRGGVVVVIGCLAMAAPFFAGPLALSLAGMFLIVCGTLEMWETFRAADDSSLSSDYV